MVAQEMDSYNGTEASARKCVEGTDGGKLCFSFSAVRDGAQRGVEQLLVKGLPSGHLKIEYKK